MEINVILSPHEKRNGTRRIMLYIYTGEGRKAKKYVSLDESVPAKQFDEDKQRVKSTHPNYLNINRKIQEAIDKWQNTILENEHMPLEQIEELVEPGKKKGVLLTDFVKSYIAECESGEVVVAPNTIKVYRSTYNHLLEFSVDNPHWYLHNINKRFYDNFKGFLKNTKKLNVNSTSKYLSKVKNFLNQAKARDLKVSSQIDNGWWEMPTVDTDTIALTPEETELMANYDWSKTPGLKKEVHRYLVAYNFLLRYSDSVSFDESNFVSELGRLWYIDRSKKTDTPVKIPVQKRVEQILRENNFKFEGGSNQQSNEKLKEIGKRCGINSLININGKAVLKYTQITTHTARRSGATNLIMAGVPERVVMKIGGWKDEKSFRQYIRMDLFTISQYAAKLSFFE